MEFSDDSSSLGIEHDHEREEHGASCRYCNLPRNSFAAPVRTLGPLGFQPATRRK
jgi:hypothetical protein